MAIDQTVKALKMAGEIQTACEKLMEALETFQAVSTELTDSGINFSTAGPAQDAINAALATSTIRHVDAAMVGAALSSGTTIASLLAGAQIAHRQNFQKMRG